MDQEPADSDLLATYLANGDSQAFAGLVASQDFDTRVARFLDAGGQTAAGELEDLSLLARRLASA